MAKNNKTFIRITNQDIYDKLEEMVEHQRITNGKVKLNTVISRIAITIGLVCFSLIAGIISKGVF